MQADYSTVRITPVVSDITEPFALPPVASPTLVVFLGSTIGNFPRGEAVRLLSHVARAMGPSDRFLLGADLVKDPAIINRAYNDSKGVTAAFNLKLLERLNRELGANFPVRDFEHRAFYSSEHRRIEMHLVARKAHTIAIPEIGEVSFKEGETILREGREHSHRAELQVRSCDARGYPPGGRTLDGEMDAGGRRRFRPRTRSRGGLRQHCESLRGRAAG